MFPSVSIKNGQVSIDFSFFDQLIDAKPGGIDFGLDQVQSVEVGPQVLKQLRGLRAPGTYAYFIIGGTFWTGWRKRSFWNARRKFAANTVRINLRDHKYQFVVIQVAEPAKLKAELEAR